MGAGGPEGKSHGSGGEPGELRGITVLWGESREKEPQGSRVDAVSPSEGTV